MIMLISRNSFSSRSRRWRRQWGGGRRKRWWRRRNDLIRPLQKEPRWRRGWWGFRWRGRRYVNNDQTLISRKISTFFFVFAEEDDDDDDIDDEDDQPSTKRQKVEDEANDWFHEKFSKKHTTIRKIENNKFALSQTCFSPKIVLNVPPTFLRIDTKMKCLKES